jgi:hypothetical protein
MDESSLTCFSQEGDIATCENRDPKIITSDPNLENTSNENAIIDVYSDE